MSTSECSPGRHPSVRHNRNRRVPGTFPPTVAKHKIPDTAPAPRPAPRWPRDPSAPSSLDVDTLIAVDVQTCSACGDRALPEVREASWDPVIGKLRAMSTVSPEGWSYVRGLGLTLELCPLCAPLLREVIEDAIASPPTVKPKPESKTHEKEDPKR